MNAKPGISEMSLWLQLGQRMVGVMTTAALLAGTIALPGVAQTMPAIEGTLVFTLTDLEGAEMLDVDPTSGRVVVVGGDTATLVQVDGDMMQVVATWTLSEEYLPEGSTAAELTGVSISADGSFALVGVKDDDDANLETFDEVPGKVVALSLPDLQPIGQITVGRGPDSVAIAPSGEFAAVANEDEENEEDLTNPENRSGSISIIDLRSGLDSMTQVEVPLPTEGIPFFPGDAQPETVKISADGSFILATLQENNAIARIEVPSPLPATLSADAFTVTNFDAGLRTGSGLVMDNAGEGACRSSSYDLSLRESFTSAREPDGIALTPDGRYFVTADEDNLVNANAQSYNGVEVGPHGGRSISIFDATTGELVADSGDAIEEAVVELRLPQRCRSKGPEPEVVSVGEVGDRVLAFVALERSDAVAIFDLTDPTMPSLADVVILNPEVVGTDMEAGLEPEGVEFLSGRNQVVVSNPENGSLSLINVTVGE